MAGLSENSEGRRLASYALIISLEAILRELCVAVLGPGLYLSCAWSSPWLPLVTLPSSSIGDARTRRTS
jgi:hypothetical protein